MSVVQAVRWSPDGRAVRIVDQRRLPAEFVERDLRTVEEVCEAIRTLAVRGAPAIGVAAAMGLVASLVPYAGEPVETFRDRVRQHAQAIRRSRPTAVNLAWALDRMLGVMHCEESAGALVERMRQEAQAILDEDRDMCERIGLHGAELLGDGARVLTHCNAGALATAGIGTALAPIYVAAREGRSVRVYADETRPLLQGSRLTAWELSQAGIPVTVLPDGAAASLLRSNAVDLVFVGADRIAANGDVANKIGTYGLALAARHHDVPFYVAAPTSTIDPNTTSGDGIPIEHRAPDEVLQTGGSDVFNPAFDITPASLITGYITDRGKFSNPEDLMASLSPAARLA